MQIRKIIKGAKKTYKRGVRLTGNTVNTVIKAPTRAVRSITKRVPVVGRPLTRMAGVPRRVTRGTTRMIVALPTAAGSVAGTGLKVATHAIFDPLLALGLLPSGEPKRITQKKKPKSRGKK